MIEKFVQFFVFYLIYINGELTRKHGEGREKEEIIQRSNIKEQEMNHDNKISKKAQNLEDSFYQIQLENVKEQQKGKNGDVFVVIQFALDQGSRGEFKKTSTNVDLSWTRINSQQVRAICRLLPLLRQLNLNYCQYIQSIKLKNCKELQILSMISARSLIDIQLEQMPSLKILNLFGCSQLQSIKLVQLTQLESLHLDNCSKLKEAIQFKNCKKIKELYLGGVDQSHQNLVQLLNNMSAQLEKLDLSGWKQIRFSQLKFNNCKKLQKLYLHRTEIADDDISRLGTQIPQLEYLSLYECKNIINPFLNNFNKLKEIYLIDTSVSQKKIQELIKKHPNTKIYYYKDLQ